MLVLTAERMLILDSVNLIFLVTQTVKLHKLLQ